MKSRKILGMVLSVMLIASACLSGCKFSDIADVGNNSANVGSSDVGTEKPEEPVTPEKPVIENAVENGGNYPMPAKMAFTSDTLAAANETGVTVTLVATVEPADAPDKSVDWSVNWSDDAALKESDITQYLTCTPETDGSTTATVTCKKSFGNDKIIIKVKTRDGGFEAFCTVTFVGIPTSLTVTTDISLATQVKGPYSFDYYPVGSNRTVEMGIVLDNGVHDVSDTYYETLEISVAYPKVQAYLTTSNTELDPTPKTSDSCFTNTNLTVSVSNKKLLIQTSDCIEAGYSYMREGHKHGAFHSFYTDTELHGPVITIKCGTLVTTVPLKVVSSVTNVTLNGTLEF